jgi:hypothetical protein
MAQGDNFAEWSDEHQTYTFHSKYNFEKFKPIIEQHFKDGGLNSSHVLAGLCHVSYQTILDWLNPAHKNFREDFKQLVESSVGFAAVITDQWHRESANGTRKEANARTLNRRAERILGLTEKTQQVITHKTSKSLEELDGEIEQVSSQIDNESSSN